MMQELLQATDQQEQAKQLVTLVKHPLVEHSLTSLRDKDTSTQTFREHARRITYFLAFEVTKDLKLKKQTTITPLETITSHTLASNVVFIPVLRAGLVMKDTMLAILPDALVGYDGLRRDEETAIAQRYYHKLPPINEETVAIILDPMLATGGSASETIKLLKQAGAKNIRLACIVAAPEGIFLLKKEHPDVEIFTCAVDRDLNAVKYIRPGLGDFGDRFDGTV